MWRLGSWNPHLRWYVGTHSYGVLGVLISLSLESTHMVVWWPLDAIWSLPCCSLVIMHMNPIRCCKLVVRSLYPYFGVLVLLWWWRYIVEPLNMFLMILRPWTWWCWSPWSPWSLLYNNDDDILEKVYVPTWLVVFGSLIPLIWWINGGAFLLVDVKSVDVKTIKSLMPFMMSIESFDLGTYA